jgi:hypothetical protein
VECIPLRRLTIHCLGSLVGRTGILAKPLQVHREGAAGSTPASKVLRKARRLLLPEKLCQHRWVEFRAECAEVVQDERRLCVLKRAAIWPFAQAVEERRKEYHFGYTLLRIASVVMRCDSLALSFSFEHFLFFNSTHAYKTSYTLYQST